VIFCSLSSRGLLRLRRRINFSCRIGRYWCLMSDMLPSTCLSKIRHRQRPRSYRSPYPIRWQCQWCPATLRSLFTPSSALHVGFEREWQSAGRRFQEIKMYRPGQVSVPVSFSLIVDIAVLKRPRSMPSLRSQRRALYGCLAIQP
jgi:hypothetical protein